MRRVFVGGAFTSLAAIIATWVTLGVGGTPTDSRCLPLPAYPDAACTGVPAGITLTIIDQDDYVVSTTNAVIEAVDVRGCIDVRAAGVTVKNSKAECITTSQSSVAENPVNAPLTIQDTEIDCKTDQPDSVALDGSGISFSNYRAIRVNIHNCVNGLDIDSDALLQDSYIHDLTQCSIPECPEPSPHTDGTQTAIGTRIQILHNTIYGFNEGCVYPNDGTCNGTSAVNIGGQPGGSVNTALIKDNVLAGGAFALFCAHGPSVNFQVINNAFSTVYSPKVGEFGLSSDCGDDEIQSGNFMLQTRAPVHLG